ncbi:MAG: hypothetical protein EPN94_05565 [Nitrospirae bacterium]|nr:MAG: hypothetical protein EPN94_05565 [Nitrospirota bacterium]
MKKKGLLNNEDGFFKFAFVAALIAFAIYAGLQFGMPQYRYSTLKTDATEFARISLDIEKTKAQIAERAVELKVPITEKDIEVVREGNLVKVRASWSETVDILGLYQKKFVFNLDIKA